jgi:UDP:flavonoid glycosyltransferase YjiC (YdhE family)
MNAAAAEAWGVGLSLRGDAASDTMRAAIETLLASRHFAERARQISRQFAGVDGANRAAAEIESLLSSKLRRAS